jgi:hypothetical protein
LERQPSLWVKTLLLYSITRLHFADIPFNFLVDSNGQYLKAKVGGMGANQK